MRSITYKQLFNILVKDDINLHDLLTKNNSYEELFGKTNQSNRGYLQEAIFILAVRLNLLEHYKGCIHYEDVPMNDGNFVLLKPTWFEERINKGGSDTDLSMIKDNQLYLTTSKNKKKIFIKRFRSTFIR